MYSKLFLEQFINLYKDLKGIMQGLFHAIGENLRGSQMLHIRFISQNPQVSMPKITTIKRKLSI